MSKSFAAQRLAVLLATYVGLTAFGRSARQQPASDALATWEAALAAKGGRPVLQRIHSFAIRETTLSNIRVRGVLAGKVSQVVCELPSQWWEFVDYRPGKMGYSLIVVDAASGNGWATHGQPAQAFIRPDTWTPRRMRQLQYLYFLETTAVQPKPQRASRERIGSLVSDRLEAEVEGDSVVYYLSPATHLPFRVDVEMKVTATPPARVRATDAMKFTYELDAYRQVDGVMVPTSVTRGRERMQVVVEINPSHDPSMFITPPSPADTIDSWRRR
jgi:hypothetical protein